MKNKFKRKAILLRSNGLSYSEILQQIPVAKSTLSLWLQSVGLSQQQKRRLTLKKLQAGKRGGQRKRQQKDETIKQIANEALKNMDSILNNKLYLMGMMLYWAEGSKSKEHNISQGFIFSNSDPLMIKLMLKWIRVCLKIPDKDIKMEIYVHQQYKSHVYELQKHWVSETGFPLSKFDRIYFKRDKIKTQRKNIGINYWGQIRIKICKSTNLNRFISASIVNICQYCGVV